MARGDEFFIFLDFGRRVFPDRPVMFNWQCISNLKRWRAVTRGTLFKVTHIERLPLGRECFLDDLRRCYIISHDQGNLLPHVLDVDESFSARLNRQGKKVSRSASI